MQTASATPTPDFEKFLLTAKLDLNKIPTWQRPLVRKFAKWLLKGGNIVETLNEGGADNYERLKFAQSLLHSAQSAVRTMKLSGGNTKTGDYVKVVSFAEDHSFRIEVKGRQASNVAQKGSFHN